MLLNLKEVIDMKIIRGKVKSFKNNRISVISSEIPPFVYEDVVVMSGYGEQSISWVPGVRVVCIISDLIGVCLGRFTEESEISDQNISELSDITLPFGELKLTMTMSGVVSVSDVYGNVFFTLDTKDNKAVMSTRIFRLKCITIPILVSHLSVFFEPGLRCVSHENQTYY